MSRIRVWIVGLVTFLVGFPLTARAFAGGEDIAFDAIEFGLSIADESDGS